MNDNDKRPTTQRASLPEHVDLVLQIMDLPGFMDDFKKRGRAAIENLQRDSPARYVLLISVMLSRESYVEAFPTAIATADQHRVRH